MKSINILLVLAFSFVILSGCEKEIVFDPQDTTSKLVVNSLFNSDSVWTVHVSRSASVIDTASLNSIFDANVEIFDEGSGASVAILNHQGDGIYASATAKPIPGTAYRLEASAPGYAPVSAVDAIPGIVNILQVDTSSTIDPDGNRVLHVSIVFQDPSGISNYYMVETAVTITYFDPLQMDTVTYTFPVGITCSDPNIETDNGFNFGGDQVYQFLLLRDRTFDGQTYTLDFSIENWAFQKEDDVKGAISLISSSEAFFNYKRSFAAYSQTSGNPFAQPVQVYSNVEGGHGIFAGGTRTIFEVDF